MAMSRISVNVDEEIKQNAQRAYWEAAYREYIKAELEKSMLEAADPDTQWVSQNEMIAQLTRQREARRHVIR